MASKHLNAAPGDFAETVLMPGDPLRAQYIAETYLENTRRVNDVRNMWGFTGTTHAKVNLRDIIIAMGASTDSVVNRIRFSGYDLAALATYSLVQKAVEVAEASNASYHVGNIFSEDLFYSPDAEFYKTLAKYDVLGVEMEAAGMYTIAAEHGVEALAICTVSDDIRTGKALSSDERATTFDEMIMIALETVRMCD